MTVTFPSYVKQAAGLKATGIPVPESAMTDLGGGRRPAVTVTIGPYSYRTTVSTMDGESIFPLSAEHRAASGLSAGDSVEVVLELDTAPRTVEVPADLAAALDSAGLRATFDALPPSHRKAHVRSIEGTASPETRARRVAKAVEQLAR